MTHQDLIAGCQKEWDLFVHHPFVNQLGDGSLDKTCFQHYLQQDYLYLIQYARAFALAVFKCENPVQMRATISSLSNLIEHEFSLHMDYCLEWGLQESDVMDIPEGFATVAYTRYLIDVGLQGDLADLYGALVPCALGYAHIGQFLSQRSTNTTKSDPYTKWIELYSGPECQKAAKLTTDFFNELIAEIPNESHRAKQLQKHFTTATRMEIAFWQQGLDLST
ncbi:thiaminase II [Microbulbifer sp. CnH-101-E]|uniref:thiaminase II n=1 Tax=unclassified Microbulbifer TaxID=2619833 RepID=UPI004038FC23